jgi:hypothetical protein
VSTFVADAQQDDTTPPYRLARPRAGLFELGDQGALVTTLHVSSKFKWHCSQETATRRLSRERRHVLQMLASSGHLGVTEAVVMAYGFSTAMLAGMACDGFITVVVDTVCAGARTINVRRLPDHTGAGRKAIED